MELTTTEFPRPPLEFKKNLPRVLAHHGDSLAAEKYFQKGWDASRDSGTGNTSLGTQMRVPIENATLTKDFNFRQEVDASSIWDHEKPDVPPAESLSRPDVRSTSMDSRDLSTRKNKKPY